MSKTRKALLVMLMLALVKRPLDKLLASMLPDISVEAAPQLLAIAAMTLLLMGVPALLLRPWGSPRLVKLERQWPWLLLTPVAAVMLRAAMTPADAAWQRVLMRAEAVLPLPDAAVNTIPMPETAAAVALYIVTLAAVPALAEEIFFRGSLLTGLLDSSRRGTAVLLTAACFTLLHGNIVNLPTLLAASLLLTLLMLHTGNVMVPVATHFFYNITAFVEGEAPVWGSILSGAALIALAVYIIARQPKMAHPPMKKADGLLAAAALAALAVVNFV